MADCLRCGNEWTPRKEHPKKCPECQNPNWDKPRTRHRRVVVVSSPKVLAEIVPNEAEECNPVPAAAESGQGSSVAAEEGRVIGTGDELFDRIKQLREQAEKFLEGLL